MCSRRGNKSFLLKISLVTIIFALIYFFKPFVTLLLTTSDVSKKRLLLSVGVLSKLSAISRRNAIRATWFTVCKENSDKVVCKFFTDEIDESLPEMNRTVYLDERERYQDLVYMPYKESQFGHIVEEFDDLPVGDLVTHSLRHFDFSTVHGFPGSGIFGMGGYNFALRLLWMLKHFTRHCEFDFFLRVDDDYFVCLQHLLTELPYRPTKALYWGYVHCTKHVVRVDEGFMILSRDLITESLQRLNTTLMCSAYGDQAVALWVMTSSLNVTWFHDNNRVAHAATGYKIGEYLVSGLCEKYIGLHGAYPKYMYQYWKLMKMDGKSGKSPGKSPEKLRSIGRYHLPEIPNISKVCNLSREFDWRWFYPEFRFAPKPCRDEPQWTVTVRPFIGREELGHEQIF